MYHNASDLMERDDITKKQHDTTVGNIHSESIRNNGGNVGMFDGVTGNIQNQSFIS